MNGPTGPDREYTLTIDDTHQPFTLSNCPCVICTEMNNTDPLDRAFIRTHTQRRLYDVIQSLEERYGQEALEDEEDEE